MEGLGDEAGPNQYGRKERNRDEALAILRRINLLPDKQRKPCLKDISHFVHTGHNNRTLFIVVGADFMGPAGYAISIIMGHSLIEKASHTPCRDQIAHSLHLTGYSTSIANPLG